MNYKIILWDWCDTIIDKHGNPIKTSFDLIAKFYPLLQGIITNGDYKEIKDGIMYHKLEKYFTYNNKLNLISPNNIYEAKPSPEMLYALLGQISLDLRPQDALFIGDSLSDEVMAEKAGCQFQYIQNLTIN